MKKNASSNVVIPTQPVGYFGPEGSFTHEVVKAMLPTAQLLPFTPTGKGFQMLDAGELAAIVVPFENSIGGAVPETLDQLLLAQHHFAEPVILEQWVYRVNLCLLGRPGVSLKNVKRIYTHFVPLQVIRPWLDKKFPKVETVLTSSTSAAARDCVNDPEGLAVANSGAADVYGLKIFEDRLAPPSKNITRFLLISSSDENHLSRKKSARKGVIRGMLHLQLNNRSGALCDALLVFKKNAVNLTQILSRPVAGSPGSHQFLIEWEGRAGDSSHPWIKELTKVTHKCRNLGEYSVHNVPQNFPAK